jgi:hypothetical protein
MNDPNDTEAHCGFFVEQSTHVPFPFFPCNSLSIAAASGEAMMMMRASLFVVVVLSHECVLVCFE